MWPAGVPFFAMRLAADRSRTSSRRPRTGHTTVTVRVAASSPLAASSIGQSCMLLIGSWSATRASGRRHLDIARPGRLAKLRGNKRSWARQAPLSWWKINLWAQMAVPSGPVRSGQQLDSISWSQSSSYSSLVLHSSWDDYSCINLTREGGNN